MNPTTELLTPGNQGVGFQDGGARRPISPIRLLYLVAGRAAGGNNGRVLAGSLAVVGSSSVRGSDDHGRSVRACAA